MVEIVIPATHTVAEMKQQNHALLNYAIDTVRSQGRQNALERFCKIVADIHPSIRVEQSWKPATVYISVPDEIYTLTQIKYSEYL